MVLDPVAPSAFQKIISSVVLFSFCTMTISQSLAMTGQAIIDTPCPSATVGRIVSQGTLSPLHIDESETHVLFTESRESSPSVLTAGTSANSTPEKMRLSENAGDIELTDLKSSSPTASTVSDSNRSSPDSEATVSTLHKGDSPIAFAEVVPAQSTPLNEETPARTFVPFDIESQDPISSDTKAFEDFKATVNHLFSETYTYKDIALVILPLVIFGVIAKNEILGETALWIDTTETTLQMTIPGQIFMNFSKYGSNITDNITKTVHYSNYILLPPYLLYRLNGLCQYLFNDVPSSIKTPTPACAKYTGAALATVAAIAAGASVALNQYSSEISFSNQQHGAHTYPPYLFAFYTADFYLRYSLFKDDLLYSYFTNKNDTTETKLLRQNLLNKLENAKRTVNKLSSADSQTLDLHKTANTSHQRALQEDIQLLRTLFTMDNTAVTYEEETENTKDSPRQTTFSSYATYIKNNWTLILCSMIVLGGTYVAFENNLSNFQNLSSLNAADTAGHMQLERLGTATLQATSSALYHIWEDRTQNINVYNGNGTDWCTQCRESTHYTMGNMTVGGQFTFKNCQGVSLISQWGSAAGNWDYNEYECNAWYHYINDALATNAGISTDDVYYGDPDVPAPQTTHIKPVANALYITAALLLTTVSSLYAAAACKETIKRVRGNYATNPEEILPGKQSKVYNTASLLASAFESAVRATADGTYAFYILQNTNLTIPEQLTVSSLTWFISAMNYFNDFDDAYSTLPYTIRSAKDWFINKVYQTRSLGLSSHKNSYLIADAFTIHTNKLKNIINVSKKDVLDEIKTILK